MTETIVGPLTARPGIVELDASISSPGSTDCGYGRDRAGRHPPAERAGARRRNARDAEPIRRPAPGGLDLRRRPGALDDGGAGLSRREVRGPEPARDRPLDAHPHLDLPGHADLLHRGRVHERALVAIGQRAQRELRGLAPRPIRAAARPGPDLRGVLDHPADARRGPWAHLLRYGPHRWARGRPAHLVPGGLSADGLPRPRRCSRRTGGSGACVSSSSSQWPRRSSMRCGTGSTSRSSRS